jgi:hypothetical protein
LGCDHRPANQVLSLGKIDASLDQAV